MTARQHQGSTMRILHVFGTHGDTWSVGGSGASAECGKIRRGWELIGSVRWQCGRAVVYIGWHLSRKLIKIKHIVCYFHKCSYVNSTWERRKFNQYRQRFKFATNIRARDRQRQDDEENTHWPIYSIWQSFTHGVYYSHHKTTLYDARDGDPCEWREEENDTLLLLSATTVDVAWRRSLLLCAAANERLVAQPGTAGPVGVRSRKERKSAPCEIQRTRNLQLCFKSHWLTVCAREASNSRSGRDRVLVCTADSISCASQPTDRVIQNFYHLRSGARKLTASAATTAQSIFTRVGYGMKRAIKKWERSREKHMRSREELCQSRVHSQPIIINNILFKNTILKTNILNTTIDGVALAVGLNWCSSLSVFRRNSK